MEPEQIDPGLEIETEGLGTTLEDMVAEELL
jgi:hypothetical protein